MRISDWSSDVCSSDLLGNAKLRPLMADTVDVSFEKYFGQGAYVSLGGFYKYLENYIYRQSDAFDFTGFEIPDGGTVATYQGLANQRSEEHTSELQSLMRISYAVFCLKKKILTDAT